jgi:PPK2 family polyphosphate:nucleotide phosphotransferase
LKGFAHRFQVQPRQRVRLKNHDPDFTADWKDKKAGVQELEKHACKLEDLQYRLYAENKRSILIVLQGPDASGKDGTIRRVMSALNPQSCHVVPFKAPSQRELAHDYLWRIHHHVPARGEIVIFNRSHYEDVLVPRVRRLVPKRVWTRRYQEINRFEKYLSDNGTTILKFFLHISKDEQKKRLENRLHDSRKRWKMDPADLAERKLWDSYLKANQDLLGHCTTPWAPWFIVPANKKWFRNLVVSRILVETLERMNPKFPRPAPGLNRLKVV